MLIHKNNISQLKEKLVLRQLLQRTFPMKTNYQSVIPLNIFQTWHSRQMPIRMLRNIESVRTNNPAFQYYFFDDNDCERFIQENFEPAVLEAYRALVPGAFKADLWRYCVLYKWGGVYLDIKYGSVNHFKLINLTEREHYVFDTDGRNIYNAVMVCKPGNPILQRAIDQIVENVKNRYYGNDRLDPTGPGLLRQLFSETDMNQIVLKHRVHFQDNNHRYVYWGNYPILKSYPGYLDDCRHFRKTDYYGDLWNDRRIYR
jgi:mannosyltransferase OCH1-like enzyme